MRVIAAAVRTVEVRRFATESQRARYILTALTARLPSSLTPGRPGESDLLLLWGPGAPDRFEPMRQQINAGGHVVALDLAYWQRDQKFRVSFDSAHPQAIVMRRALADSRLAADGVRGEDRWSPTGPVVVAGIGSKAGVQYGADRVRAWELAIIAEARRRGRPVIYRPKRPDGWRPDGVAVSTVARIDDALAGASLVATWHSNVAVDAIRLGIPAICQDGAAAAVCPSAWPDEPQPLPEPLRRQFLANLAWFQWAPSEASAFWGLVVDMVTT